jgi:hypothetical protein
MRTAIVVAAMLLASIVVVGPMAFATTNTNTPTVTGSQEEPAITETQNIQTQSLTDEQREVNGIEFTPRWGEAVTIGAGLPGILFADCEPDEFAVSSQFLFETSDLIPTQSFPVGLPDDLMMWIAVIDNTDTNNDRAAAIGAICAGESGDGGVDRVSIDLGTTKTINNVVKNVIKIQNNQITNLYNVINIRQTLVQNAVQILSVTGNNNVVNQVINQTGSQIASISQASPTGPTPAQVQQTLNENAEQQGVTTPGGPSLSQLVQQDASQQANATDGGTVSQEIDQNANQTAAVTDGAAGANVNQTIGQGATQTANVTGGGGPTALQQLLDQQAQQQAQVTQDEEEGAAPDTNQEIQQGADQTAQVQEGEEEEG